MAAILGFAVGWLGTSAGLSRAINWDTAAYVADLASGRNGFSSEPWSSHYALGPVYLAGMAVARVLGGTALDGVRLLIGVAMAASAMIVARVGGGLAGRRDVGLIAAGVHLFAGGTLLLVSTWEDNVLFMPFGLAALAVSLAHHQSWNARASLFAGALVGAGTLLSWQAVVFAFPPLYAAVVLGGPDRGAVVRVRQGLYVLAGLVAARVAWGLAYAALSHGLGLTKIFRILFARPEPNFFPDSASALLDLAGRWKTVLRQVGIGLLNELAPSVVGAPGPRRYVLAIGVSVVVVAVAVFLGTLRHWRRSGRAAGHLIAATALAILAGTAAYVDLPTDKHKRYDFLPPLVALLLAAAAGAALGQPRDGRRLKVVHLAGGVLLMTELVLAATGAPAAGTSWFEDMRRLRRQTPRACGYVFAFDELREARYQLEIQAALWSELPQPMVVGAPAVAATWPRPLPIKSAVAVRAALDPCHHVSAAAQAVLDGS